jgi:hypothetical protein
MPQQSSNVPDTGATAESEKETLELLNEEDVAEPEEVIELDKPKSKKELEEGADEDEEESEETETEDDELKEIEEELKGPKDEDLELTTPVRRKEILAKYPKLFKDFPYLEKAYYREQQFTEVFPTIQDAHVSAQKAAFLDQMDQDVMQGSLTSVLNAVKQADPEAFNRVADNYLWNLRQIDERAYYNVLGNVVKDTIVTMVREARALGEQGAPLQAAANVLNQFVFGSQTFTPPQYLARRVNQDEQQRQWEQNRQDQERFNNQFVSVRDDLQTKADNVLIATIDGNIDPRGSMTAYVKNHAVREAHSTLEDLIARDTRFRGLLDRLWQKAFERGFDKQSTDQIKSAYLSKAKTLLPSVIKKARNEALKGLGSRSSIDEEEMTPKRSPSVSDSRNKTPVDGRKIRKASDIPKNMSTLDFLNSKD